MQIKRPTSTQKVTAAYSNIRDNPSVDSTTPKGSDGNLKNILTLQNNHHLSSWPGKTCIKSVLCSTGARSSDGRHGQQGDSEGFVPGAARDAAERASLHHLPHQGEEAEELVLRINSDIPIPRNRWLICIGSHC